MLAVILPPKAFLPEHKEDPSCGILGQTPRYLMQTLGTEWGRNLIGQSIWTSLTQKEITELPENTNVLIDDARFDNEILALKELEELGKIKTIVVEIRRGERPTTTPEDAHPSEAGISPHLINLIVPNDDLQSLREFCASWVP
jgi:hypothetical protein